MVYSEDKQDFEKFICTSIEENNISCCVFQDYFKKEVSRKLFAAFDFPKLFIDNRHYKTMLITTMTSTRLFPPVIRCNVDFVFVFETDEKESKHIFDDYFDDYDFLFKTFEEFKTKLREYVQKHGCMLINNTARKKNKIYGYFPAKLIFERIEQDSEFSKDWFEENVF